MLFYPWEMNCGLVPRSSDYGARLGERYASIISSVH
jgi:hypothetical protein